MGASASKEPRTTTLAVPASSINFFSGMNTTLCEDAQAPPPPPPLGGQEAAAVAAPPPPPSAESSSSSSNNNTDEDDAIAKAAAIASAYKNPGPFESAAMDAKRLVTLDTHDGFRCDINKQLSPHMAVVHSFWLGTNMLEDGRKRTYTWLTQVADADSLYMARCDPEKLSCDGRIHKSILGGLGMVKLQLGLSPEGQADQALCDIDLGALTWTANLKYGTMGGGLVYGCNFYQAITPALSMGGEGMYISANQSLLNNYLIKYSIPAKGDGTNDNDNDNDTTAKPARPGQPMPDAPSSTMYGAYNSGQSAVTLNYKRVVTPNRVTLGAELTCNPMTLESAVVLGAEFKWSRSKLQVAIDGGAKMQSLLETKLGKEPGQPTLTLSADLDHLKDEMKFGYGLSMDG
jgi:mitochondrial import receptor subunit TOM40